MLVLLFAKKLFFNSEQKQLLKPTWKKCVWFFICLLSKQAHCLLFNQKRKKTCNKKKRKCGNTLLTSILISRLHMENPVNEDCKFQLER